MRPIEILLLLCEAATLVALAYRPLRSSRWLWVAVVGVVAVAVLQVSIEGYRWQMVPGYGLGVLLVSAALVARQSAARSAARAPVGLKWAAVAAGLLGLTVSVALPSVLPVFSFAAPTGPYGIGTMTYHWVDQSRPDLFAPKPGAHRELMAQVWYPARRDQSGRRAPYVSGISFAPVARLVHMPAFFLDHLSLVRTNAQPDVPIAADGGRFPVVIFSTGRGGYRQSSTFQIEELVSQGYVVFGIDHPYTATDVAFPDGRHVELDARVAASVADGREDPFMLEVLDTLGADAVFALDQIAQLDQSDENGILTGRLDVARAGIFGTSLGGITTAEACRLDSRFKACLILDVDMPPDVVASGLSSPTMWISRGPEIMRQEGWTEAAITQLQTTMHAVFGAMSKDGYLVLIPGMYHTDMTDFPLIMPPPLGNLLGANGPADWRRTHAIINAYSLAFFDRYLKGTPSTLLDGPVPGFPEVEFERRP